jgi:hypothetical protein
MVKARGIKVYSFIRLVVELKDHVKHNFFNSTNHRLNKPPILTMIIAGTAQDNAV